MNEIAEKTHVKDIEIFSLPQVFRESEHEYSEYAIFSKSAHIIVYASITLHRRMIYADSMARRNCYLGIRRARARNFI